MILLSSFFQRNIAFVPFRYTRRTLALSAQKGGGPDAKKDKNPYAETILLPDTAFSQRANAAQREPEIQSFWKQIKLYETLSKQAEGQPRFILHDGPPYANGDLHCGHALNKILKDFINRHQILNGKQVHFIPGWDCHGLPIELKVLQSMSTTERQRLTPIQLRTRASAYAQATVQTQSIGFQRFGIIGDFDHPYLTLLPEFEAAQIQVFGQMFRRGFIFRGRKPVHWSPSSRTALAEAELEYPDNHISKSIYATFVVENPSEAIQSFHSDENPVKIAIWTTTPWTIPANMAVAVNPVIFYSIVQNETTGKIVVATDLISVLESKLLMKRSGDETASTTFEILATVTGEQLAGTTYTHPLYKDRTSPVLIGGDYITTASGTGLVHTAPGHGQEDYMTGLQYDLDILSPVDDVGRFTIEAGEQFVGLNVLAEGNTAIIQALAETKSLLKAEDYGHKYPYDWRTKKPTIFRATDQWFASVEGFRDAALEAVESVRDHALSKSLEVDVRMKKHFILYPEGQSALLRMLMYFETELFNPDVQWIPSVGKNRIRSFVEGRGDWCISRQRSWGLPIPVFYDSATGTEFLLNDETLSHIQELFLQHGSDCWWTMDEEQLLPPKYKAEASKWKKGSDTMDVWFDSGSSWAGVVQTRDALDYPADLYLEGSDQHRGWFQSSLLTSVANNGHAPFKAVLTHGFVLDEKGFKMSKSLGNVVDPMKVIEGGNNKKTEPAYGADVLRLWVANSDYSSDISIGDNIIKQTFETYRKLRNTARYLIGNLADFVPASQPGSTAIPYESLPSLDKWMLGRLCNVLKVVNEAFDNYQFQRAVQEIIRFANSDLSNFYLDVAKDRLYISGIDDPRRRSCQTVLHACIEGYAKAVAPILPHMAEDIWQSLPYEKPTTSVFEGGWPVHLMRNQETVADDWELVRALRDDINKMLEAARADKLLGASLDGAAFVYVADAVKRKVLEKLVGDDDLISPPVKTNGVDELRTVLMLSEVHIVKTREDIAAACATEYISTDDTLSGCVVGIRRASGQKCERCWFYDKQVGHHNLRHSNVCLRCNKAISQWEDTTGRTFAVVAEKAEAANEPVP